MRITVRYSISVFNIVKSYLINLSCDGQIIIFVAFCCVVMKNVRCFLDAESPSITFEDMVAEK